MKRLALAVLATAVVGVAPAQAQTCIGYTPFSVGTLRLGGDLTFADHATQFGATGAFGSAVPGLFGSVSLAGVRYDGAGDPSATLLEFGGGYSVPAKSLPSLEFCPVASFSHQFGPDQGGVNTSAIAPIKVASVVGGFSIAARQRRNSAASSFSRGVALLLCSVR